MRVAFATTLSSTGSTIIGRVKPLANEFARQHDVHILLLERQEGAGSSDSFNSNVQAHTVGREPFQRGARGKKRLGGVSLVLNMLATALRTAWTLLRLNPDRVIIVKALPHNVLGVTLWYVTSRVLHPHARVILDVDDFELEANELSSLLQRAAIHWAERMGSRISHHIVAATPFLSDHFTFLTAGRKPVTLIPTGIDDQDLIPPPQNSASQLAYLGSIAMSSGHRVDLLPTMLQRIREAVPTATLLMAGDGHDTEELKVRFQKAQEDSSVHWHGRFALSEVKELLEGTAVLLDPVDSSIATRAKSSYRVLLAALHGRACVTSNVGVRPLLLPAALHDRFFAAPNDAHDYAAKVIDLIQTPLRDDERHHLREHAQQFTWKHLGATYQEFL